MSDVTAFLAFLASATVAALVVVGVALAGLAALVLWRGRRSHLAFAWIALGSALPFAAPWLIRPRRVAPPPELGTQVPAAYESQLVIEEINLYAMAAFVLLAALPALWGARQGYVRRLGGWWLGLVAPTAGLLALITVAISSWWPT